MARTEITVQVIPANGSAGLEDFTWTAADATNDMMFENTGKELLLIRNDSAGSLDVDVVSETDKFGRVATNTVSTAASNYSAIGPFDRATYNQNAGETDAGKVYLDITTDTSLFVAVLRRS